MIRLKVISVMALDILTTIRNPLAAVSKDSSSSSNKGSTPAAFKGHLLDFLPQARRPSVVVACSRMDKTLPTLASAPAKRRLLTSMSEEEVGPVLVQMLNVSYSSLYTITPFVRLRYRLPLPLLLASIRCTVHMQLHIKIRDSSSRERRGRSTDMLTLPLQEVVESILRTRA